MREPALCRAAAPAQVGAPAGAGFALAPPDGARKLGRLDFPAHLLIPLASAVLHPLGALLLKRAHGLGVGVWRTAFVANWAIFLLSLPMLGVLPGLDRPWPAAWWQPLVVGALFFSGQAFTYVALTVGDVSVATPLLGSKILLVAIGSAVLLPDPVPVQWWIAAACGSVAVALLSRGGGGAHQRVGLTVVCAVASAGSYAIADVLLQKWTPAWGAGQFMPLMFLTAALLSFSLIPRFKAPLSALNREAWTWVLVGAVIMGVQSLGIAFSVGLFGDATAVNIVYSLRGLFSVLAVWWIGRHFGAEEGIGQRGVLRQRLTGAVLMISAVVLVLF